MKDLVTLFQALSDATRLRLLSLMTAGDVCVCYFVEILDETQPKISRHLADLRRGGLVSARRGGKRVRYCFGKACRPAAGRGLPNTFGSSSPPAAGHRPTPRPD